VLILLKKRIRNKNMAKYEATTPDKKCIFCEIVSGHISKDLIFWEDEEFMAFLSIDPNTPGFSCVIPKKHFDSDVLKLPDGVLSHYILATKKVAKILENYYADTGRVGLIMEGTGINHAHIKLSPMHGTENLKRGEWQQVLSGKEFWFDKYEGWISSGSGPMADFEKLKILATNLKKSQK
jgi:histidine triad (HIT) family protein